jgi:L-asparaginase
MEDILILTTGGTIDKIYFDAKSSYEVGPPRIQAILDELNLAIQYEVVPLMQKDSLEMTDSDRAVIGGAVRKARQGRIIITHGTDTMVETARSLPTQDDKTIVMTGSLEPALFTTSDALFNIGCSIAAVQTLGCGIYITMNGNVFDCNNVRKNYDTNRFEPLVQE